jgi:CheY-like chemotaxis protein
MQEPVLEDRIAALGTLAAGAAHQINAPLTSVTIHVEHVLRELRIVLSQGIPLPEDAGAVERVAALLDSLVEALDGAARIREIVRHLLVFSRGTIDPHALVDVRSVVESSIQMALHELEPRACIVRELAEVPPVEADQAQLGQAFLNLMVNAAQAIPEGDPQQNEVRIATYADGAGNAVVEVSDTGVGILPDVLPRVFEPFFTSRGVAEADGLGLSIALGTVRALGGNITVSSDPGGPTVFRAVMPPAKGWRASSSAAARDASGLERPRMLVVDDHQYVGDALRRALSALAEVESTTDGRAVVDRLGSGERWDVILCDLLMPGTSGMDVYREALRVAPDAASSIVFMTAGAVTPRARAFLEGVGNPCLEKPLDMAKLRSLVTRSGRFGGIA